MIISRRKEKMNHAIAYFLNHTSMCNKKKLYKLLYILDFEHFEITGRSVTSLEYFAWEMGPVPKSLDKEIRDVSPELVECFDIEISNQNSGYRAIALKPKFIFDEGYFSRRELKLLKDISDRFYLETGKEMEIYTHKVGMPWHQIYEVEKRKNDVIPYDYQLKSLEESDRNIISTIAEDRASFLRQYS